MGQTKIAGVLKLTLFIHKNNDTCLLIIVINIIVVGIRLNTFNRNNKLYIFEIVKTIKLMGVQYIVGKSTVFIIMQLVFGLLFDLSCSIFLN